MRINFQVSDEEYFKFREIVGSGNMSNVFRDFISRMNIGNIEESELKKSLKDKKNIQKIVNIDIKTIEMKIDKISKDKELIKKSEEEKFSFDPFAHMEKGRAKINELQILLYRVEKGKIIPEWAKTMDKDNPKEFAIKVLNRIIKEEKI